MGEPQRLLELRASLHSMGLAAEAAAGPGHCHPS